MSREHVRGHQGRRRRALAAGLCSAAALVSVPALAETTSAPAAATSAPLIPVAERPDAGPSNHGLGLRARWVTVPGWSLAPYLAQGTGLDAGWSVAASYVYYKPSFDVVVSLDYSSLSARNGNFLGKGNDPATENHFLVFDGLSSLSADVSLVGHWNILPWMEFRLGGGLGIGGVFGDIYQITNNSGCTAENGGDPTKCYPKTAAGKPVGPINDVNDPATLDKLRAGACANGDSTLDTPGNPCFRKTTTYPLGSARVVPVINAVFGFRFKLARHAYLNVDAGWRLVGFFAGAGPEFRF